MSSMKDNTHSVCQNCWDKHRKSKPIKVNEIEEKCCFCGDTHSSGIYLLKELTREIQPICNNKCDLGFYREIGKDDSLMEISNLTPESFKALKKILGSGPMGQMAKLSTKHSKKGQEDAKEYMIEKTNEYKGELDKNEIIGLELISYLLGFLAEIVKGATYLTDEKVVMGITKQVTESTKEEKDKIDEEESKEIKDGMNSKQKDILKNFLAEDI